MTGARSIQERNLVHGILDEFVVKIVSRRNKQQRQINPFLQIIKVMPGKQQFLTVLTKWLCGNQFSLVKTNFAGFRVSTVTCELSLFSYLGRRGGGLKFNSKCISPSRIGKPENSKFVDRNRLVCATRLVGNGPDHVYRPNFSSFPPRRLLSVAFVNYSVPAQNRNAQITPTRSTVGYKGLFYYYFSNCIFGWFINNNDSLRGR